MEPVSCWLHICFSQKKTDRNEKVFAFYEFIDDARLSHSAAITFALFQQLVCVSHN